MRRIAYAELFVPYLPVVKIDGKEEDEKWLNVLQTVAKLFLKKKQS